MGPSQCVAPPQAASLVLLPTEFYVILQFRLLRKHNIPACRQSWTHNGVDRFILIERLNPSSLWLLSSSLISNSMHLIT